MTTLAIGLSACGSSGSDADDASDTSSPSESASPQEVEDAATEPSSDEGSNDGDVTAEAGTGTLTVDGVQYPDFAGDCFIHRGLDPETYLPIPVGDLSEPGLTVVVGVDNVASAPDVEANFIMTSETTFRMAGIGGTGTIDSIAYVDPGTSSDSVDLAPVAFTGTTDDAIPVVAELICEIGLD